MRRLRTIAVRVIAVAALLTSVTPHAALAQSTQTRAGSAIVIDNGPSQSAREVKSDFKDVLNRYPPALGKMLKLDPGLMNNQAYLAPYPAVWTFIQQHPEIPRDPGFYLDFVNTGGEEYYNTQSYQQERWRRDVFSFVMGFIVVGGIALTLGWIIRYTIEHRRWLRATKLQSELQHKLLERIASNQELLSYVQSPAGQNLLQSLPAGIHLASARDTSAPHGRILLSAQIGFILAAGGAGLLVSRSSLGPGFEGIATLMGTIGIALGIGFGLAAAASYLLSQKFGLFDTNPDNMRPSGRV
jgi:hypothetical protein